MWYYCINQINFILIKKKKEQKNEKLEYNCFRKDIISLTLLRALKYSTNGGNSELSKCFSFAMKYFEVVKVIKTCLGKNCQGVKIVKVLGKRRKI